jgi:hypothetical protein
MNFKNIKNALCLSGVILLASCNPSADKIGKVLNEYNFIQLVPASNIYKAGSIIHRENYDSSTEQPKRTFVGALCIDKFAVDRYSEKPRESASETRQLRRLNNVKFNVDAPTLKKVFDLSATADAAEAVSLKISDLKVSVYSKEDLFNIRALLNDGCRNIINTNITKHDNAYQIRETLTASIEFSVKFKANADADAKLKVIRELGSIGAVVETTNSNKVKGDGLVYGIKWDKIRTKL